ncbi:MAG: THUMP domain-containing protein [Candidatus Bathyarchaeia archaeon]
MFTPELDTAKICPDTTLVAYSEIALKSRHVRRYLENLLVQHVRASLRLRGIEFDDVLKQSGRIFVIGGEPYHISKSLCDIFGIEYSCPVIRTQVTLEAIREVSLKLASSLFDLNDSFAIDARRTGTHSFTSKDLENEIGASVLKELGAERKLRVDLENPRKSIFIEVRDKDAFVFSNIDRGVGGLPYGSQGKILTLLLGDEKSTVANWLMMKRGSAVTPIHISFPGEDNLLHRAVAQAELLKKFVPSQRLSLLIAPLRGLDEFSKKHGLLETAALRVCISLEIALETARKIGAFGLATADSELSAVFADSVSYTTFETRYVPIYYPLLGLGHEEVAKLAQRIGVTEFEGYPEVSSLNARELVSVRNLLGETAVKDMILNAVNQTEKINVLP